MAGPCAWTVPEPPGCCTNWDTFDPALQTAAIDYATTILWASTGRRFGLCPKTVRPCGVGSPCGDGSLNWSGWWYGGGGWLPYIFNGTWFNCGCPGACNCDPRCQILLPEPVASVTAVRIGGAVVDPSAYRVDNHRWLVRTDGDCWPECPDMDTDNGTNVFEVDYAQGDPVPSALLTAAGTLACEYAKACTNADDCRLPQRVQQLVRQGVTVNFVDVDQLLDRGLVGITEIDALIRAYNPGMLTHRPRVRTPDIRPPRETTFA